MGGGGSGRGGGRAVERAEGTRQFAHKQLIARHESFNLPCWLSQKQKSFILNEVSGQLGSILGPESRLSFWFLLFTCFCTMV